MAAEQVDVDEATTRFFCLVDRASVGEEFIIARAGRPMARLVPMPAKQPSGPWKGTGWIGPDVDELTDDATGCPDEIR